MKSAVFIAIALLAVVALVDATVVSRRSDSIMDKKLFVCQRMSLGHVDLLVSVGEDHTDDEWMVTPMGYLPARPVGETSPDVYAHLRVTADALTRNLIQPPRPAATRVTRSDKSAKSPSIKSEKSCTDKSEKSPTSETSESRRSASSASKAGKRKGKGGKSNKRGKKAKSPKVPCTTVEPTSPPSTSPTTLPAPIIMPVGYGVYYGGDFRPVDLKEENKTTSIGIWNTNMLVPTSDNCELSVDKCNAIVAAYQGPASPGFTHSAEVAAKFDIIPVAGTRRARRAGVPQRRSGPGQPPYDMTLTDLDRKIVLTSNVFVNNVTCEYDTSEPNAPCIPKAGKALSFESWCQTGDNSGKGPMGNYDASYTTTCDYSYPVEVSVSFPTGFDNFTAPCVPYCGLEEQLSAACPYARWTLRRGTPGATVGGVEIRENNAEATVITPGTAGTAPTLIAEGYAEYTFKRTGRMAISGPELAMTLMADISSVDLTVSGNYYFSLTPECTLIDTNNADGHVTGDGTDQWNLPYMFLSNVPFPEADLYTLANAYGPVQPENSSLFNGETYSVPKNTSWTGVHDNYQWVSTQEIIDERAESFVDAPDRWSMGINMIWVPKTNADCTTCFGLGSECDYLAEQNGAKFDTVLACTEYIAEQQG